MKRIKFHPAARVEFRDAILFYDERAIGLGREFTDEVDGAIRRITEMPLTWPKLSNDVRRCLLNRFPYAILYRQSKMEIEIIAVMHQHRHPDTWKTR